jgi:Uma2 family endonuclease
MVAQVTKPSSTVEPPRHSPESYLEMEVQSEERHEYRDGEIVLMTGGTPNHNKIAGNIYSTLNFAFRGKPYQVFIADQRLWMPEKRLYGYPDVMVIDGELQLQPGRKDTLMNSLLILEVLSKSTQDYDRGDKFAAYRTIPDFQEYLLVNQYKKQIEHYVKTSPKKWNFQEYDETDIIVPLRSIGLELAIADIYDKVTFVAETVEPEQS